MKPRGLTKHYGEKVAVEDLSFTVRPGVVTGFLGPNGSGKSTTMRMIMGLDAPNRGRVRVNGQRFRDLRWPLREVGALLEAARSIPDAPPGHTCSCWPRRTNCRLVASTTCSSSSG